jgi:VWFA-related protein
MRRSRVVIVFFLVVALPSFAGQQKAGSHLRVNSRAVLVDVVVTDNRGNPVRGLPKSAFHVIGEPQVIDSFETHAGVGGGDHKRLAPRSSETAKVNTEARPARNVLLIDTSRMDVILQMSLYKQLLRFVRNLPPGMPVAVFLRAYASPVMLQDFTADHKLIEAAISRAIPHLQKFGAALSLREAQDYLGPQRVAEYLSQVPGRKNLLWFLGGTNTVGPIALANAGISMDSGTLSEGMRRNYDVLQTARVSIYPIDVRGLEPQTEATLADQHLRETAFAEETGGKATYNANDIAMAAGRAIENGENYYTLSYAPNDLHGNGGWHELRVAVDGGQYQLSYRRGYFEDISPDDNGVAPDRKAMIAVKEPGIAEPDSRSQPLVFRAQAVPAASNNSHPKRGERSWKIHYDIPALELEHAFENGTGTAEAGAAIVAFNQDGWVEGQISQKVVLKFEEAAYKALPRSALSFDQTIDLPAQEQMFLYIAVWDAKTGRMGTVDLPLDARVRKSN